jgi:hypothetical protein
MKKILNLIAAIIILTMTSCNNNKLTYKNPDERILFLHHSTGMNVWKGEIKGLANFTKRIGPSVVPNLLEEYNKKTGKKYSIESRIFPIKPYPWENYPYDYYNIWVKNAGNAPFLNNPTLEILTSEYNVIIFKHCFPFSNILPDDSIPDVNSKKKTITNYTLQYNVLKSKLKEFPNTKFIIWTGAALVEKMTNPEEAERARKFTNWLLTEWDEPGDNIYFFDFRDIETEGGLYLKPEYAVGELDSHPNEQLSIKAASLFVNRIIEVIEKSR